MAIFTERGVEHGMLRRVANSVREDKCKREPKAQTEYEKKRKRDSEKIRVRYINYADRENGILKCKPYCRYAGDPIEIWTFLSGYSYDVPRGLVDEVNESVLVKRPTNESDARGFKPADRKPEIIHEFVSAVA